MPKFSDISLNKLATCHPDLITLFNEVIKYFDCIILEGHRGMDAQEKAVAEGKSKLHWPHGKHNAMPSLAVDAAPYDTLLKVDWKDINRFYYFAGHVMGIADILFAEGKITHKLRYGGDWNKNTQVKDENFKDLGHFEIIL